MKKQDNTVSIASDVPYSREDLEQHLRARAWKDGVFRQEFQVNPKGVLQRDYAQWFPEGKIPLELSIKVIEEEEQVIYFVLPSKSDNDLLPELGSVTLDDLNLSGGTSSTQLIICTNVSVCYTRVGCTTNSGDRCRGIGQAIKRLKP